MIVSCVAMLLYFLWRIVLAMKQDPSLNLHVFRRDRGACPNEVPPTAHTLLSLPSALTFTSLKSQSHIFLWMRFMLSFLCSRINIFACHSTPIRAFADPLKQILCIHVCRKYPVWRLNSTMLSREDNFYWQTACNTR